ncbi:hypothetical protein AQJ30_27440 [Streptomyces longwoodensis]|uniref:Uncharacterized protein n=1 Tax=Streptomyces longwoodensis TaxID=68231 RepID=A0A101QRN7_9ACTN|nr:hypothetical protein [Streptomyces longwoodensis]KUN34810.1 hypothetical protein AQJ30_27440 [Streptomyces longwoodensis]
MTDQPRRRPRAASAFQARGAAAEQAAAVAAAIRAECDAIDTATTDPDIRAATARIRTTLTDGPPAVPCTATEPDPKGGAPYTCSLVTKHAEHVHFDEQRRVHWLPDAPSA